MASPASTAQPATTAPAVRWLGVLADVYRDGAFRFAVKFGLAGMLAVYVTLLNKLPEPTWALLTVFVLMIAQYVGAIVEKSLFRLIGTIVGGLLGYTLTGSLEQQPVVFLVLIGLIVGVCTTLFGQARYPYAFFLCGMTVVVVVSNGLANPSNSWQFALNRIQEISVGIMATMLVQCVLWPRYARVEFLDNARQAFEDLESCFRESAKIFLGGPDPAAARQAENFPARIPALRGLLSFAGRESHHFRQRLPTFFEITTCLSRIGAAIVTLGETLPENSLYRETLGETIDELHDAIGEGLSGLAQPAISDDLRRERRERIEKGFETMREKLDQLRQDPRLDQVPAEEAMQLGIHLLALEEIRQQIRHGFELFASLPESPVEKSTEPYTLVSPIPPPFWIRAGIKGALSAVSALVIYNWLNPPGGTTFVLGAWIFTALNAGSPGGRGDQRAFHYLVYSTLAIFLVSILLILIRPMLSSYAVMNTVIFTSLFVWGYHAYSVRGVTIPMQIAMLMIVGVLGLNGQEPISFQSIVGYFMGLVLAIVVSTLVQRLLWPSLPQWELRDRLKEFVEICHRVIREGPSKLPLWQRARIALIPGEAFTRIALLKPPVCPRDEPPRLEEYMRVLRRLVSDLFISSRLLPPLLPPEFAKEGEELMGAFEAELGRQLEAHEQWLETSEVFSGDDATLEKQLGAWREWVAEVRKWFHSHGFPVAETIRVLGLAGRYEQAAEHMLKANALARELRLKLYMGDYVL